MRVRRYDRVMKVLFAWYGGKARKLKWILPHIPYDEGYCEPFFGSGAVFFARVPSPREIINDIDHDIVNFFSVLRDRVKCMELERCLYWTPYSRVVYEEACKRLSESALTREAALEGDIERAYWWFIAVSQKCFGVGTQRHTRVRDHISRVMSLYAYSQRLRNAYIECADGIEVCRRYDCPEMVFYLDPPYLMDLVREPRLVEERYQGTMSRERYEELIEWCIGAKGSVVLSSYDAVSLLGREDPLFQRLIEAGWRKVTFQSYKAASLKKTKVTEALFINPRAYEKLSTKMPQLVYESTLLSESDLLSHTESL